MRKALVVAAREYFAAVKTKSFVIGVVLMPILMGGGIIVQALLKDQVDPRPKHFAVIDRTPGHQFYEILVAASEARDKQLTNKETGQRTKPSFQLERVDVPADANLPEVRLDLSERVRNAELTGFLEIGPDILKPAGLPGGPPPPQARAVRYQTNRPSYMDFPKWVEATIHLSAMSARGEQKGLSATDVATIIQPVPLLNKGLTKRDPYTGEIVDAPDQNPIVALLLPGGLVVLMFMVVLMGCAPLMQGVMEEKMQRIAEVLLGSVRPFPLMMGKLLGMAGVSLTMAAVYLSGAYWAVHHFGYAEYLTFEIIAWFLLYQVLAVFMFGSLYTAVGAACADMKEAQAMMMPVTLVIVMPMFVWIQVVQEPTSAFSMAVSLFPPATPLLMVARQSIPPGIPLWQPLLGVVLMVATTLLCVYAAGRIFRVGILMQGKGARFADLARWVIRG
jgi:ABC-2 type transport system permease protein